MTCQEIEPRLDAPITTDALSKAFTIALLLTGGVQRAEAVLLDAIGQMDPDRVSDDALMLACVKHATTPALESAARIQPGEAASALLPPELVGILLLPAYLRHSFVLRVLLKLSLDECNRLNVRNANQGASAAARELARIRDYEQGCAVEEWSQ